MLFNRWAFQIDSHTHNHAQNRFLELYYNYIKTWFFIIHFITKSSFFPKWNYSSNYMSLFYIIKLFSYFYFQHFLILWNNFIHRINRKKSLILNKCAFWYLKFTLFFRRSPYFHRILFKAENALKKPKKFIAQFVLVTEH